VIITLPGELADPCDRAQPYLGSNALAIGHEGTLLTEDEELAEEGIPGMIVVPREADASYFRPAYHDLSEGL